MSTPLFNLYLNNSFLDSGGLFLQLVLLKPVAFLCSKVVLTDKITLYMMKNKNIKYYIFVWSKDKKKKLTDRKEQKMELVNGRM